MEPLWRWPGGVAKHWHFGVYQLQRGISGSLGPILQLNTLSIDPKQ